AARCAACVSTRSGPPGAFGCHTRVAKAGRSHAGDRTRVANGRRPSQRRGYEYEKEGVKHQIAAQSRLEQLLRARESEAAQALNTEQARWIELNTRLDELERLLARVMR